VSAALALCPKRCSKGDDMLIDMRFGFIWYRTAESYRFAGVVGNEYYWEFPFVLDVEMYAREYAW